MARYLPKLNVQGIENSAENLVNHVRSMAEFATNGDPNSSLDYRGWLQLARWGESEETRKVIEDIIKGRLKLPWPYNHKALLLAQTLPPTSLPALINLLNPLIKYPEGKIFDPNDSKTHVAMVAAELKAKAETIKSENDNKNIQDKFNLWNSHYGRTNRTAWPLPPKDPVWGNWAVPVSRDFGPGVDELWRARAKGG